MHYILLSCVALLALLVWVKSLQRSLDNISENSENAMMQIGIHLSSEWEIFNGLLLLVEIWAPDHYHEVAAILANKQVIGKNTNIQEVIRQEELLQLGKVTIQEIIESCPELASDPIYLDKIKALHHYENMVSTSRLIYNDTIKKLNYRIHLFPVSIVAKVLGFSNKSPFDVIE